MNKPKSVNHLDKRFKKLRNNREGQNIGEFFIPVTTRAMTEIGINYKDPF